jgi:hypothetical protein
MQQAPVVEDPVEEEDVEVVETVDDEEAATE